jgi:hypothetical protein
MDVADWLVECELWHFESGGYWLNDFLDYNPSKSKVLAERERGRVRAKSSHESRPKTSGAFAGSSPEDTPDLRRIFGESSHGPVPVPVPVPRETETPPTVGGPASPPTEPGEVTKTRRRKKPKTFCPESRASAGEIRDWSDKWAIPIGHGEFTGFLDYHRKHDSGFCDWSAAWRTWLKNAPKFATRGLAQKPAEITKQPADLTAPWLQDDYVGKNTGT